MRPPPPIYQCLTASTNRAVDTALLGALSELEEAYKIHAIEALLNRGQGTALEQLVQSFHALPEACKSHLARRVDVLEPTLRAQIRSAKEQARFNVIDVVLRSGSAAMSYLLGMGLHSPISSTRGRAALALRRMVAEFIEGAHPEPWNSARLHRLGDHYRRFAVNAAHRELLLGTLREALDSYEVHMRTTVVEALLMMSPDLEPQLLAEARRAQSKCWRAILDMLRHAPNPEMAPLVLSALSSDAARSEMVSALGACRDDALMAALMDHAWMLGDPEIRRGCAAIRKLSWLELSTAPLFEMSAGELSRAVRFIEATSIREATRVQWYRSILLSDHVDKQRVALHAIVNIRSDLSTDVLRVVIDWANPELAGLALRELIHRRPEDVSALQERRGHMHTRTAESELVAIACADFAEYWEDFAQLSGALRRAVGRRVMSRDPQAFDALASKLSSAEPAERVRALQIVKTLRLTERYKAAVFGCARDTDRVVRSAAIRALAQLDEGTSEMILRSALDDTDGRVRANAIDAMDELGLARLVERIQPSLKDGNHRVRAAAIKALLRLQVREAAESLIDLLKDPSRAHRVSALWVIEQYGLASLLEKVTQIAQTDPDEEIRSRARRLLKAERMRRRRQRQLVEEPET